MRIFLMGATPRFDLAFHTSPEHRLGVTGGNSGNQVIADGLLSTFRHDSVMWHYARNPSWMRNNIDVIVIAAANFLYRGFDFSYLADILEENDGLPVVVVGLGAQASSFEEAIELKPGTERFLSIIAERAKLIGVRGEFTRRVLERRGIHNVQITGCPSYYVGGPEVRLSVPPLPVRPAIVFNGSRDVISHAFDPQLMRQVLGRLATEAISVGGNFVAQTEMPEIILASGAVGEEADRAVAAIVAAFQGDVDSDALGRWARGAMKAYWSVPEWREAMQTVDFCVGTRFHGNMVAMQVGRPAMIICHDTRTTEMPEFLGLPHVTLQEAATLSVRQMYDRVDPAAVAARRFELFPAYFSFLRENGLEPA